MMPTQKADKTPPLQLVQYVEVTARYSLGKDMSAVQVE
jgi:hypothetical protein